MPSEITSAEVLDERPRVVEARAAPAPPEVGTDSAYPEPPSFISPGNDRKEWEEFGRYKNYLLAEIAAGLLENEGVPAVVASWAVFPGITSAIVWVPKKLMHRARWIVALAPPSDEELLYLATGELPGMEEGG